MLVVSRADKKSECKSLKSIPEQSPEDKLFQTESKNYMLHIIGISWVACSWLNDVFLKYHYYLVGLVFKYLPVLPPENRSHSMDARQNKPAPK